MKSKESVRLQVGVRFSDQGEAPPLQACVFTRSGKLLGSAAVEDGNAVVAVPSEMDGHMAEVIPGPRVERDQSEPTAASLGFELTSRIDPSATAARRPSWPTTPNQ